MLFRRIKSRGLAHHSYYLADGRDAVVIDPRRDADVYLDLAREHGHRITHVLETHRNEDYAIGSTALRDLAGATILHGPKMTWGYGQVAEEGQTIGVGNLEVAVIETPGHTDESLSYAVRDESTSDDALMVFTGDALFAGDTGRVDLYGEEEEKRLAEALYASIHDKILTLGDGVILHPAHGGGSVCGGAIAERDQATLGYERRNNPLLAEDREAFIEAKRAEMHLQPPYFKRMEEWNQRGTAPIHGQLPLLAPLSPSETAEAMSAGAVVIDTRMPQAFAGGHLPGSYNIWLDGVASYLGWIVQHGTPIVLVVPVEAEREGLTRTLLRLGYDEIAGYLHGGFGSWQNEGRELERFGTLDTQRLQSRLEKKSDEPFLLDVRKPSEVAEGRVPGAEAIFLGELEKRIDEVPKDRDVITMCGVGSRASIAASILARKGHRRVYNYLGGFSAWQSQR